MRENTK